MLQNTEIKNNHLAKISLRGVAASAAHWTPACGAASPHFVLRDNVDARLNTFSVLPLLPGEAHYRRDCQVHSKDRSSLEAIVRTDYSSVVYNHQTYTHIEATCGCMGASSTGTAHGSPLLGCAEVVGVREAARFS